ncbi:hypothetical protein M2130_002160 [Polynucleobacter sphagniphilus]|nr:hypothetical protein [Polynucleobacter sphagniphilus]
MHSQMENQMKIELGNTTLRVTESNKVSFSQAKNVSLECVHGDIWLTFNDLQGDFLLTKGERLIIPSNGIALIQGLPAATVKFSNPQMAPSHLARLLNSIRNHFLIAVSP